MANLNQLLHTSERKMNSTYSQSKLIKVSNWPTGSKEQVGMDFPREFTFKRLHSSMFHAADIQSLVT